MKSRSETIIEPRKKIRLANWAELWNYRDLYYFLVWRGIKTRYSQSVLGIGWAVIQPFFSMIVYTIVFGMLANIESNGVPYALFSFTGLIPWTFFSNALTDGANSLVTNSVMISKVYFPRIILPFAAVTSKLVDFSISLILLALLMAWYGYSPNTGILVIPLLVALMTLTAAGLSAWLTALAVQYRDVQHSLTFAIQLLMYATPVIYPTSLIPKNYQIMGNDMNLQLAYAINPMVAVIEGFRSALLGTSSIPWDLLVVGTLSATTIFLTGIMYFHSREHVFSDVA